MLISVSDKHCNPNRGEFKSYHNPFLPKISPPFSSVLVSNLVEGSAGRAVACSLQTLEKALSTTEPFTGVCCIHSQPPNPEVADDHIIALLPIGGPCKCVRLGINADLVPLSTPWAFNSRQRSSPTHIHSKGPREHAATRLEVQ